MDEVKGRVVAACCLDDTVPMFLVGYRFVYINTLHSWELYALMTGVACTPRF